MLADPGCVLSVLAEVGLEHGRAAPDRGRVPADQRRPLREHRDVGAHAHHELHVVLDDEDRLAVAVEVDDAVAQVVDQRRVDAAGRLVQQQHRRVGDQQRRELQELALTVGEVAGGLAREPRDPDEVQQLECPLTLAVRSSQTGDAAQPPLLALRRDEHVLQHGQPGEHACQLERAPDAESEHPVR